MPEFERFDPRPVFGVDQLPRPSAEIVASVARAYPPELRAEGVMALVLLSVDIDEHGAVQQVKAVRPLSLPNVHMEAHLHDSRTGEVRRVEAYSGEAPPALRAAAEQAVRDVRFLPAERDGHAVAFWDLRLSVQMAPPASSAA